jgi:HJR/Mrr/RecB family endonuclease
VIVTLEALDAVAAESFETLVLMLLESEGFTPHGAWLEKHGEKTALFIRQQSSPLDTPVVQEALVARTQLGCEHALVVTNATFGEPARELATSNRIELVDRAALRARLETFNKSPKDYARVAALLGPRPA